MTIDADFERAIARHRQRRTAETEAELQTLMARHQNDPANLARLGALAQEASLPDYAVACLQRAAALSPRNAAILTRFADAVGALPRHDVAIEALERAIAIAPTEYSAGYLLGGILNKFGEPDRALEIAQRLQVRFPEQMGESLNIVRALVQLGRFDEAEREAREIIARWPERAGGFIAIAHARKFRANDPLIRKAEALAIRGDFPLPEKRDMYFALGKMYDDIDAFDQAFAAFSVANQSDTSHYDRASYEGRYQEIAASYTDEFFRARQRYGFKSTKPVLVVGMPRSGTTLVESMLAAHPEVDSIGESHFLRAINQALGGFVAGDDHDLARMIGSLSAEGAAFLGRRYVQMAMNKAGRKAAQRIVDKLPHNFVDLGLAALTLSDVRVIHVRRSPMAIALSCWMQNFNQAHPYSANFTDLAHHIALYRRLMAHWAETIGDRILDVDYEQLVREPEAETRRMLAWIGLSGENVDLRERRNLRVVTTASVWQVRQPVYQEAIERWKAYEHHLGPLKEALESYGIEPT